MTPTILRYHPSGRCPSFLRVTLAVMFPNRVVIGLGSGESLNDVPALGFKWPGFIGANREAPESITIMRRLWTEERVKPSKVNTIRRKKRRSKDRPTTPVPVYLAASGPTVAKMAGQIAEGYMTERQGARALSRNVAPECRGRTERSWTRRQLHRSYDRDEGVIRYGLSTRAE